MDAQQSMCVDNCVVLVDSHERSTITNIVLCTSSNILTAEYDSEKTNLVQPGNLTLLLHF